MDAIDPGPTAVAIVGVAAGIAVLQLVLARWRDLGPLTVAAGGIAALLVEPDWRLWLGVAGVAAIAGAAWARGATRGVGHPGLDGLMVGLAVAAGALGAAFPLEVVKVAAASSLGLVGAVLAAVALRRRGARRPGVRWVGEIPIGRAERKRAPAEVGPRVGAQTAAAGPRSQTTAPGANGSPNGSTEPVRAAEPSGSGGRGGATLEAPSGPDGPPGAPTRSSSGPDGPPAARTEATSGPNGAAAATTEASSRPDGPPGATTESGPD